MIHSLFTIYDSKAAAYLPIFQLPVEAMAQRTFSDCVNSDKHQFSKHPHDYTLFVVGTIDDATAEIILNRQSLGNGVEFLNPDTQPDLFPEKNHDSIGDDAPILASTSSGNTA